MAVIGFVLKKQCFSEIAEIELGKVFSAIKSSGCGAIAKIIFWH